MEFTQKSYFIFNIVFPDYGLMIKKKLLRFNPGVGQELWRNVKTKHQTRHIFYSRAKFFSEHISEF